MSFERIKLTLYNAQQAHAELARVWQAIKPWLMAGHRLYIEVKPVTRSLEQNSRLWLMLTEISKQVDWYGQRLSPDEWKDVLSAAFKQQKAVPGINGGFVILGARTSQMSVAEMCEMQELAEAFAAEKSVVFPWTEMETA